MTDASSVTTFVVGDHLPWPDESSPEHEKGPFDSGAVIIAGSRRPCSIRKVSALGVTIASDLSPPLGERASVELATGQRAAGKIAWTGRSEIGIRFDDSVDVIALLNRKLVSQTRERRTMPRLEVRSAVHIKCGGAFHLATLRNISARGLQVEGDELPAIGVFVSAFVEGLNIPAGEVVWKRGNLAGVELFEELSWTSLIPWVRALVKRSAN
jgi:PilZ domain-containing protein